MATEPGSQYVGYIIDTNTLRALVEGNPFARAHYERVFPDRIFIPVVTYAEEVRGWVNPPSNDPKRAMIFYKMLMRYLHVMQPHEILPFTGACQAAVGSMPPGVGIRDKRIAAYALVYGHKIVTTNRRDSAKLLPPDLLVDWTIAPHFES